MSISANESTADVPELRDSIALALVSADERWFAEQLVRSMGLYLILWVASYFADLVFLVGPFDVTFAWLLVARLVPLPIVFASGFDARRRGRMPIERVQRWLVAIELSTTVWVHLVASRTGGIASPVYLIFLFIPLTHSALPLPVRFGLVRHFATYAAFLVGAVAVHAALVREGRGTWELATHWDFILLAMCAHAGSGAMLGVAHVLYSLRLAATNPTSVGRYVLRRRIGRGGMGEVWAAWHTTMRREVALKLVRVAGGDDHALARRFEREVQAMVRLAHPNTVKVFDFGAEPGGLLYYAMELLEGEDLAAAVDRDGPFSLRRAHAIALSIARALAEAHALGIVHRDMKPENVFLAVVGSERDVVKILDFGIALVAEHEDGRITREDVIAGTPATISPDVLRGEEPSPASDVYSFGCVLYFMLAGELPFGRTKRAALLDAHLHVTPTPPSVRRGLPIPETLEALALRCLAKEARDRYADAGELASALAAIDARAFEDDAPRLAQLPSRARVATSDEVTRG